MKVNTLKSPPVNQNGYHKNSLTKERIGTLFIYPIDYTPDDCLSCDGYSLQITDYEDLYKVIGTKFNQSGDAQVLLECLTIMSQNDSCNRVVVQVLKLPQVYQI